VLIHHVALVPERAEDFDADTFTRVAAALQKQVTRDFAPIWEVNATVDAFASMEAMPIGYWPIVLTLRDLGSEEGVHLDKDGQPYSLVQMSETWSLTTSHELLELLVDPYLSRTIAGNAPDGDQRVEFLLEVCDPCQSANQAYFVNDVLVSDFFTPRYFDPIVSAGTRYSFSGAICAPREVLDGGYLSWRDPASGDWWQRSGVDDGKKIDTNLGQVDAAGLGLRRAINQRTPNHRTATRVSAGPILEEIKRRQAQTAASAAPRANRIREHIRSITGR